MELRHVMTFWMAIAISLGLHWNMNACALVLRYWSRLLLLLLLLFSVLAFCFPPFSLVFLSFLLDWHVLNFPLLIQREWKNDAHMAIRDCYAARKIDNSSYKALYYMSEALSQVILLYELQIWKCSLWNNALYWFLRLVKPLI